MQQQVITGAVFIYHNGKALIIKRSDTETFAPGNWELPGGHVDFGETLEQAMGREAKEETGLYVEILNTFHQFTYVIEREGKHYIEVILNAKLLDPNQEVKLNPQEHSEYKWISNAGELENLPIFHLEKAAIEKGFESKL